MIQAVHHQGGEAESLGREAGEPWVGLGCLSVRAGGREAMMQPHRDMNEPREWEATNSPSPSYPRSSQTQAQSG